MSDLTLKYIADLDAGVRDLFASDRWRSYLEFLAKFHRYSANNTIAIYLQRPTASLVASFSDWRRKGRKVKKGEHGIKILAPHVIKDTDDDTGEIKQRLGFHIAYCFDVSQTDGADLPEGGASTDWLCRWLCAHLGYAPGCISCAGVDRTDHRQRRKRLLQPL